MAFKNYQTGQDSYLQAYQSKVCNMRNPFEHFLEELTEINFEQLKHRFNEQLLATSYSQRFSQLERYKNMAQLAAKRNLDIISSKPIQAELEMLMNEKKKKAQQKLISKIRFSTETFIAVPLYAWDKHKMPYTTIKVDHLPKELHQKKEPDFFHKNYDGSITYEGITDMTEADMRIGIEKRNYVFSEFIGDELTWYCFFRTMTGIKGREEPHIGFPHLHFISSAWGISRDLVTEQLSSYRYKLSAETIPFETNAFNNNEG